jgi:hypothetical protein
MFEFIMTFAFYGDPKNLKEYVKGNFFWVALLIGTAGLWR